MAAPLAHLSGRNPASHLDKRSQAHDPFVPLQRAIVERSPGTLPVLAAEPMRQQSTRNSDKRPQRSPDRHRWLGQDQPGEGHVVGRRRKQRR